MKKNKSNSADLLSAKPFFWINCADLIFYIKKSRFVTLRICVKIIGGV